MRGKVKSVPKYLQLYETLRENIIAGNYVYGQKLPSKRIASEENDLSVISVEHAYALLCDEGYVQARERSGYFVSYREEESFSVPLRPAGEMHDSTSVSGSIGDFSFNSYAKTMRKVLSQSQEKILEKTPGKGSQELRTEISHYLARSRNMQASPDQIVIGAGAEYLYGLIVQILGTTGIYAMEKPSYDVIEQVYRAYGVQCELLELGKNGIKTSELLRTTARVLHITPYRSYPSGVTASASKKGEYLRWVSEKERFIVEDDVESEFTPLTKPEDTIFSLDQTGRIFYVNSFSRTMFPALRMAYMVIPKEMETIVQEKVGFYSCPVPTFEQCVLAEYLRTGEFERHINRVRRKNRENRH